MHCVRQEAERSAWLDEEDQEENATFVWGTNVSSQTVRQRARRFLTGYREPDVLEAKYVELIRQVRASSTLYESRRKAT